jgi:hypothetical protein
MRFSRILNYFSTEKGGGTSPRASGPGPMRPTHESTVFNKYRSSKARSSIEIKTPETFFWLLIMAVSSRSDGPVPSPSLAGIIMNRAPWALHGQRLRRSSVTYKARNSTTTSPTQSRPRGDTILLTCDGENESQRAGGDSVVWMIFNGDEGSFRRRRCRQGGSTVVTC